MSYLRGWIATTRKPSVSNAAPVESIRPPRPVRIAAVATTFKRRLKKKSAEDREAVQNALKQMALDLNHASLRVRPIESKRDVWEARASQSLRISFSFIDSNSIRLRVNCSHDQVYGTRG